MDGITQFDDSAKKLYQLDHIIGQVESVRDMCRNINGNVMANSQKQELIANHRDSIETMCTNSNIENTNKSKFSQLSRKKIVEEVMTQMRN